MSPKQQPKQTQHQQRKQQLNPLEPTKLDYEIAKYIRHNLPNKEAMFLGLKKVNYFIGCKAVDLLMQSKWAQEMFKTRQDASMFLHSLLIKKFFHRARKIVKQDSGKKKFKLDMHDIQEFEDAAQPFIWLYEPTSLSAWLLCMGVIFAVIAVCLFPLWPPIIRTWVYYLSMAALILFSSIIGLALVRYIIFAFVWVITIGKIHFWLLPNLTEDVGIIESFWPIYSIETSGEQAGANSSMEGSLSSSTGGTDGGSDAPPSDHAHQD